MYEELNKKNVLVTGSSRGIGAATIREFAAHGYNVVINYSSHEKAAYNLKREIENKYNVKVLVIKANVDNESECIDMINQVERELGTINVLVNNAGIAKDSILEEKSLETFRKVLDINLIGTFLMCKHVGLKMLRQKNGSIVNISSDACIDAHDQYGMDYDASKAGVVSLTKDFATYYAPMVRVNCIAPGWVNTDMNKEMDSSYRKDKENNILLGRFANPEEIAKEIYHVAVESTYINGSVIKIDGGKRC